MLVTMGFPPDSYELLELIEAEFDFIPVTNEHTDAIIEMAMGRYPVRGDVEGGVTITNVDMAHVLAEDLRQVLEDESPVAAMFAYVNGTATVRRLTEGLLARRLVDAGVFLYRLALNRGTAFRIRRPMPARTLTGETCGSPSGYSRSLPNRKFSGPFHSCLSSFSPKSGTLPAEEETMRQSMSMGFVVCFIAGCFLACCGGRLSEDEACTMAEEQMRSTFDGNRKVNYTKTVECTNFRTYSGEGKAEIKIEYETWQPYWKETSTHTITLKFTKSDQGWYIRWPQDGGSWK